MNLQILQGNIDKYRGVTVNASKLQYTPTEFASKLHGFHFTASSLNDRIFGNMEKTQYARNLDKNPNHQM